MTDVPASTSGGAALGRVESEIAPHGLRVLGWCAVLPDDHLPPAAAAMVLVGNAGSELWPRFARERRDEPDPLDHWTRRVLTGVAARLADAVGVVGLVFPFEGPPYRPFQQWAVRAGTAFPSPIGPLIHRDFGLWHAYRGALLLEEGPASAPPPAGASPCDACVDRPCLTTCPVSAFSVDGYDVAACVAPIESTAGSDCMEGGCRARRACPVGRSYHYTGAQARFHMDRFVAAQRGNRPRPAG
jgi:hypothetical protein